MKLEELALGPEGFKEYDGHFWGFLETRPYMRARHGLGLALLKLGEEEAAIEHFRAMLKLNPGDNQGIRYLLLGSLLRGDDIPALKTLLADYADEWSAYWLYTRALIAYREGQGSTPATPKLLKDARSANEHVPALLAIANPPMPSRSDYLTVGGADEAADTCANAAPPGGRRQEPSSGSPPRSPASTKLSAGPAKPPTDRA